MKVTGSPAMLLMRPKVLTAGSIRPKDVKKGAIIAANHTSFYDPVFGYCVFWRRKMHSVATKDLYNSKFKDFFFRNVHCIKVDKQNFSMSCFHEIKEVLLDEKLLLIFPEGKLNSEQNNMLAFKSGVILMAYTTNKPIIPLYIVKPDKWYKRWYGVLGDPIDIRSLCGGHPSLSKINEISEFLQNKEEELKEFYLRSLKNDK